MINVRNPKIKEERISMFFEINGLAKSLDKYLKGIWKKEKGEENVTFPAQKVYKGVLLLNNVIGE